ncbi:hypothetical protein M1146_00005 [Patescibacteria group bacterium]|nr:hypothetical protein [Patescibacteria group bacterium]
MEELYDGSDKPVAIPEPKSFITMSIFAPQDQDSIDMNVYLLALVTGNHWGTSLRILESSADSSSYDIQVGSIMSPMMTPPDNLFALEMFLRDTLPKMESMVVDKTKLTMKGAAAKIVLSRPE